MEPLGIHPVLDALNRERLRRLADRSGDSFPHAAGLEIAEFYFSLVRASKPRVVIEIGRLDGYSTAFLALALKGNSHGHLYSIEISPRPSASALFQKLGLVDVITLIDDDSKRVARHWSEPIDFLFIDGEHTYSSAMADLEGFYPSLIKGAVVVFHDSMFTNTRCQIPAVVSALLRQKRFRGINLPMPQFPTNRTWGVALLQKT